MSSAKRPTGRFEVLDLSEAKINGTLALNVVKFDERYGLIATQLAIIFTRAT